LQHLQAFGAAGVTQSADMKRPVMAICKDKAEASYYFISENYFYSFVPRFWWHLTNKKQRIR